jgi:hypothetical protein
MLKDPKDYNRAFETMTGGKSKDDITADDII